jgi:hypothetical protein
MSSGNCRQGSHVSPRSEKEAPTSIVIELSVSCPYAEAPEVSFLFVGDNRQFRSLTTLLARASSRYDAVNAVVMIPMTEGHQRVGV